MEDVILCEHEWRRLKIAWKMCTKCELVRRCFPEDPLSDKYCYCCGKKIVRRKASKKISGFKRTFHRACIARW